LVSYGNHDEWQSRRVAARNRVVETFSLEKMIAAYHSVWRNDIRTTSRTVKEEVS